MLDEYIVSYIEAWYKEDKKEMEKIEKDLEKLGMDRMTLRTVAKERYRALGGKIEREGGENEV